jgi:hypothetical protein
MKQLIAIGAACLVVGAVIGLMRSERSDPEAVRLIRLAMDAPATQDYAARATVYANYGDRTLQSEAMVYKAKGGKSRIEYRLGSLAGVVAGSNGPNMNWRFDPMNRSFVTDVNTTPLEKSVESSKEAANDDPNDLALDSLLDSCRARIVKRTSIANRPATEVMLDPKSGGDSRLIWIDNDHGVILRSEEKNPDGEIVAATIYRSIEYGKSAPPDWFLPIPPSGTPVHWMPESDFGAPVAQLDAQKAIHAPVLFPSYTPKGFARQGIYVYKFPGCTFKTAVTRYVNGLDSVTIVQAPKECAEDMGKRPVDFGLGKAVFAQRGDSYFAVMGELPESELQRISRSISP